MKYLALVVLIVVVGGCSTTPNTIVSDFGCEFRGLIFDRGLPIFDGKTSFECEKIDGVYLWVKTS